MSLRATSGSSRAGPIAPRSRSCSTKAATGRCGACARRWADGGAAPPPGAMARVTLRRAAARRLPRPDAGRGAAAEERERPSPPHARAWHARLRHTQHGPTPRLSQVPGPSRATLPSRAASSQPSARPEPRATPGVERHARAEHPARAEGHARAERRIRAEHPARAERATHESSAAFPGGAPRTSRGPRTNRAPHSGGAPRTGRGPRPSRAPFRGGSPRSSAAPRSSRTPRPGGPRPSQRQGPPSISGTRARTRTPWRTGAGPARFRPGQSTGRNGANRPAPDLAGCRAAARAPVTGPRPAPRRPSGRRSTY